MALFETELAADAWTTEGTEEPWHRLLATFSANGTPHHLEAIAVRTLGDNGNRVQEALEEPLDELLDGARMVCGCQAFQTTTIEGHEYVILMTPYEL